MLAGSIGSWEEARLDPAGGSVCSDQSEFAFVGVAGWYLYFYFILVFEVENSSLVLRQFWWLTGLFPTDSAKSVTGKSSLG